MMEKGYKLYDIKELKSGDHLCILYKTDDEHKALITPYLRYGLENNEKVFYIVDARSAETVLNYLREDDVDVDSYLESGQLKILTVNESYMKGGIFDPDGMIRMLTDETNKALAEGYEALRVTGEMSWALKGLPGSDRLIEYETKLNEFFPNNKALAICQYDCRVFKPDILLEILTTHPIAVLGTEIYENFYYIPTADFLEGKIPAKKLKQWIENLKLRKKTELDLKLSEEKYREVFNNANDAIFLHSITDGMPGNFMEVNEVACDMLGYTREELLQMGPENIDNPENVANMAQVIKNLQKEGKIIFESVQVSKKREFIPVEISSHIFELNGKEMILSIAREISERNKAEKALEKSEKEYRDLFENMIEGFAYCQMIFDDEKNPIDWIYIKVNPAFDKVTGLKNVQGKKATEAIPGIKELQPELFDIYGRVALTGIQENIEINFKPLKIWLKISVFSPEKEYFVAVFENITKRKKAEKALKKSEEKYRQLVENAQEGIWSIDAESKTRFVNQRMAEILGYEIDEMMGKSLFSFMDKHGVELANYNLEHGKQGLKKQYDFEFIRKDGNKVYTNLETSPIFDDDKNYVGAVAMVSDITERKKMEKTLRESEKRYSITLDAVNDGLWEWDVLAGDAFFSPNYYKLLGYAPGEFPANYESWRLLVHPDDIDLVEKKLQKNIKSDKRFEIDLRMKTKSIEWLWVSIRGKAVERDSLGTAKRMVGTLSDIRERVNAKKKIKESLEEKEILLKEIHHRVKNNLMIISSLLNLQSGYIKDKASKDIFKESQNRAKSMALIHERLYSSADLKRIDFGDYIQSLSKDLFNTYKSDSGLIALKMNVENIFLDINTAIPLGLIVNEFITNSLKHAFPNGRKGEINVEFHEKNEEYEFAVKDNGIGFPKDIDYQNTESLGLQIVTNLTGQIDGKIEKLDANPGTEFKINFKEVEV
jgi:PAS domain S-box-containing protein